MPLASLDGVRINYRQVGTGPDVVLVHGLAANQAFWNLDLLSAVGRRFRATTFDLRGHGYSEVPGSEYRPADMALDLRNLLNYLAIEKAHVVGHSYGGVVALQFAVDNPERIQSLTIADSRVRALQPEQPLKDGGEWPLLRTILNKYGVQVDDSEPELGIFMLEALATPHWDGARERFARRHAFVPFGEGGGKRSARRWLRLLNETTARKDFRAGPRITVEQLVRFPRPVLALYGERSPNLPTGHGLLAHLPVCRFAVAAGVGHFHPVTLPEFFRDSLLNFLADPSCSPSLAVLPSAGSPLALFPVGTLE